MNTDPIADYLTRIRNAVRANHRVVEIPASNLKKEMTKILFDQGYILSYKFDDSTSQGIIKIALKYTKDTKESVNLVCVNMQVLVNCHESLTVLESPLFLHLTE